MLMILTRSRRAIRINADPTEPTKAPTIDDLVSEQNPHGTEYVAEILEHLNRDPEYRSRPMSSDLLTRRVPWVQVQSSAPCPRCGRMAEYWRPGNRPPRKSKYCAACLAERARESWQMQNAKRRHPWRVELDQQQKGLSRG